MQKRISVESDRVAGVSLPPSSSTQKVLFYAEQSALCGVIVHGALTVSVFIRGVNFSTPVYSLVIHRTCLLIFMLVVAYFDPSRRRQRHCHYDMLKRRLRSLSAELIQRL